MCARDAIALCSICYVTWNVLICGHLSNTRVHAYIIMYVSFRQLNVTYTCYTSMLYKKMILLKNLKI